MLLPIALTLLSILLAYMSVRLLVVGPLRRTIARLQAENTNLHNNCDAWARGEAAVGLDLRKARAELQKECEARAYADKKAAHWHEVWKNVSTALGERNQELQTKEVALRLLNADLLQVTKENEMRKSKLHRAGLAFEELKRIVRISRAIRLETQTKYNALRRDAQELNQEAVSLREELEDVRKAAEHFEKRVYELQSEKLNNLANAKSKKRTARARR